MPHPRWSARYTKTAKHSHKKASEKMNEPKSKAMAIYDFYIPHDCARPKKIQNVARNGAHG